MPPQGGLSAGGTYRFHWTRSGGETVGVTHLSGVARDANDRREAFDEDGERMEGSCAEVAAYLCKRAPRWAEGGSLLADLDDETEEGELLTRLFNDDQGAVPVPSLASRPKWRSSASCGGLVLIETVRVDPKHRGRGLGLELINDLLERELHQPEPSLGFNLPARMEWNLAVLRPISLTEEDSSRGAAPDRLRRYFARAGFWPAGTRHSGSLSGFWCAVRETREKLSKEAADALELPPDLQPLSEADRELKRHFLPHFYPESKGVPSEAQVRDLIAQGADIARAKPIHHCVSNGWGNSKLEMFLRLGANVNVADEATGETALHVLAHACPYVGAEELTKRVAVARKLLELGASRDTVNDEGLTPAAIMTRDQHSFAKRWGDTIQMPKPCFDLFEMLLPPENRSMLVHGCLSPRMHYRLKVSTEVCPDICRDGLEEYTRGEPLEPHQIDDVWLIDSIPVEVRAGDIYPSFVRGWVQALEAVRDTFAAGEALTVSNVRRRFQGMYASHFEGRGGSVAHAIDAILDRSEGESEEHGDGTFFDVEEFKAEHDALICMPELDNNYAYVRHKFSELNGAPLPHPTGRKRMRGVEDYLADAAADSDDG